jgi:hypothetical protein
MKRRTFLQGLGSAAAGLGGLSLLPLFEREVAAQSGGAPRRFIVFFTPNGMTGRYPGPFAPTRGPSGRDDDFAWSEILAPFAGGYAEHGLEIGDMRSQLLITQGIDMGASSGSHSAGAGIMLTAAPGPNRTGGGGPSIDQALVPAIGADAPFGSLQLAVQGGDDDALTTISYRAAGAGLPSISDPLLVYDRLFGAQNEDPVEREIRLRRQGSVLDRLTAELGSVRGRVSVADRYKLDAHLEAIRAIERRLAVPVAGCGPDRPTLGGPEGVQRFAEEGRLQMDLLAAALRCDQTRVATLMWGPNPNNYFFRFLDGLEGNVWPFHEATHEDPDNPETHGFLVEVAKYYVRQFAYLMQLLANTPEGDGSMLDHTQLLWVSETSNPYEHSFVNMPFILGGGGAGFRNGRYVRFDGKPHGRLYVSIAQGLGATDIAGFGTDELAVEGDLGEVW